MTYLTTEYKRVCIFVGSRANYGRLIALIREFRKQNDFLTYIIGANTLAKVDNDLVFDFFIDTDMHNDTPNNRATTIGLVSIQMATWFAQNKVDFAICHGDRFETLGFAIAANMSKVPLVHMEAGEISNVDNGTRWAISALSQFHMCNTKDSYQNMQDTWEGIYNPYFVGSPMVDLLINYEFEYNSETRKDVIILYNPVDENETQDFLGCMYEVIKEYKDVHFCWVNPNIDPGNKDLVAFIKALKDKVNNMFFYINLDLDHYLQVLKDSRLIIGNASSGIHEAYVLEKPYIMYGARQGKREVFDNTTQCCNPESLKTLIAGYLALTPPECKYKGELGNGDCSKKVIEILRGNRIEN